MSGRHSALENVLKIKIDVKWLFLICGNDNTTLIHKTQTDSTELNLHLRVLRKKDLSDNYLACEFLYSRMGVVTIRVTKG